MTIPDGSKNSQGNKSRHSPREYSESQQHRKYQFYSIQGKGMNIHNDQKKLILNKLFKGGQVKGQVNYQGVNSSFNEQLMNQTNFGFNPAR